MAIELCTDISSSTGVSPRISFSHDLKNTQDSVEDHRKRSSELCLLDSSSDFVFCISSGFSQQLPSADELFSDGKIVPMEINKASNFPTEICHCSKPARSCSRPSSTKFTEKKRLKEFLSAESDAENEEQRPPSKSFMKFNRSNSLNCETNRGKSLIRSLQFLSRSNSTGSVPNQKEIQKQRLQKESSVSSRRSLSSSSSSSSSTYYFYSSSQKPSLKTIRSSGIGVRISPVLNLPQAYFPKATMNFFGFGSLFCSGKNKKKK